jgi:hypothetical protein
MSIRFQMDKLISKDKECRAPLSRASNFPKSSKIEITFKIIHETYIYPNFSVWCLSCSNRCNLIYCIIRSANKGLFRIICVFKQSGGGGSHAAAVEYEKYAPITCRGAVLKSEELHTCSFSIFVKTRNSETTSTE